MTNETNKNITLENMVETETELANPPTDEMFNNGGVSVLAEPDPEDVYEAYISTYEIGRGLEYNDNKLEYSLRDMEDAIASLQTYKTDVGHTHTEYATTSHTHTGYVSQSDFETLSDIVDTKSPATHTHTDYASQSDLDLLEDAIDTKADTNHTHTEYVSQTLLNSSIETLENTIDGKANLNHSHSEYATTSHSHDDAYYTEAEIDIKLADKSDSSHTHTGVYDASGSAANALTSANAYTDSKIDALVGEGASTTLDTIGEISSAIEDNQDAIDLLNSAIGNKANVSDLTSHINNTTSHITATERNSWNAKSNFSGNYNDLINKPDIPSIDGLATETYVDTQIEAIDIPSALSDLTTDSTHRLVTDAEKSAWNAKSNFSGSYNDLTNKPSIPSISGLATETYVDEVASTKANSNHNHDNTYDAKGSANNALTSAKSYTDSAVATVKNDLLNGAGTAYDTLKELGDLIDDNADAISALETVASGKANATHSHAISDVTNLQSALDGKASTSHGTHVSYSTTTPVMDGNASVGTASTVARSDHKHPTDTSRASKTEFDGHASDTTKHITSTERTNWNASKSHADSAHAPSNAEKNQNAFSNVKVGSTTIAADTTTDTLTLVAGDNITITPDATGDSVTIAATDTNTTYSAGAGISLSGTTFSNSGVRSISTGSTNGTISVNTNGASANIAVKGLGSAAYTASTAYDAAGTAQSKADIALASAKAYTDSVKSDLLNGAGSAYDTLKELGDLIDENVDAIEALETVAASKASATDLTSHTSNKSNPHNVTLTQLGVTATTSELNKMDGVTATTEELNILDGVTATTAEINYLDGVTSSIQSQLNAKASSSHGTHVTYSTTAPKANGTASVGSASTVSRGDHVHPLQTTISGNAGTATKLATARTISLTGDVTGSVSFDGSANASITATVADDSHNHTIANVDGLQTALNVKSDNDHRHYPIPITVTGQDLNDYTDAGFYTFAASYAPTNAPSGNTNGWLFAVPWVQGNATVKQFWLRHGSVGSNDFETFVRTRVGSNAWGSWSKFYTTSNPPTASEVGAISKSLQFTDNNGSFKMAYNRDDGKNILTEIASYPIGFYTVYSQSGTAGNPKDTEAWRFMVHKTGTSTGWVQGYGSIGSVYTNYMDGSSGWRGWQCIYDTAPPILWMGEYWCTNTQTVTPSKALSKCRNGWVLVWSDYDTANETATNGDCFTTVIPKWNPNHVKWSGQSFIAVIPSGLNDSGVVSFAGKRLYVHDTKITGHTVNDVAPSNDVCLRAIYEY